MPVTCTSQDRNLHAAISGDIEHHGAKAIMRELEQQIDRSLPIQLIIDCSGVSFMDSSGIAVILRARQRMDALGGGLRVVDLPPQAAKVLRTAGLHRLIAFE